MSEPMLTIFNHHVPGCGDPPIVDNRDLDIYVGYFMNGFGEQWIFTHNHQTGVSELRGGDIGWNAPAKVVNGRAPDLILNDSEITWLSACWKAAVNGR